MAIRPGITGNPAELLDGAKVNSLTEYTVGNGVQLQGRTNGVAIEAGKVGERLATTNSKTSATPGTYFANDGKLLTKGVWLVIARAATVNAGTLSSNKSLELGVSTSTSSITSSYQGVHLNDVSYGMGIESSAYVNISSDTTYYATARFLGGSGTGTLNMTIEAIRIA